MGAAAPLPLCINGKPVCKLNYGCYYKLELASGDYLFTQGGWGWPLCRQPVHVIAGKTLYLGYYRSAYHYTFEVAEDQNEARQVVSKLKPEN
jgi:hypothetical protein